MYLATVEKESLAIDEDGVLVPSNLALIRDGGDVTMTLDLQRLATPLFCRV